MGVVVDRIATDEKLPARASVVIIGGGVIGVSTALWLAQKGVDVALCEKGWIAHEQSSRNWGWVRVMGRDPKEIPLGVESLRMWRDMDRLVEGDTGFKQAGIVYAVDTEKEVEAYEEWLEHARPFQLDSRLLKPSEIADVLPGVARKFAGAIYTPSDARAEPQKAVPAMAAKARKLGATIVEQCAVRGVETKAGRVSGVVTEKGVIACDSVVLAGGAWSRLFCGNFGVDLPQLKVLGSVMRTEPLEGPPTTACGGSDFAFRKRFDGGYNIAQRSASAAEITPDSFRLFTDFFPSLLKHSKELRIRAGARFVEEWKTPRRWKLDEVTPFEKTRVLDPKPAQNVLDEAKRNLIAAFPAFKDMKIADSWGGYVDATPDAVPVIGELETLPGFFFATGFSGHGFGIGPGAGRLVADLVTGDPTIVDAAPYSYKRFARMAKSKPDFTARA
ncbi:FAD-binding oxidoreductase [Terrarubrum flagellatum]|uniref:NAD(P)/FAD-dependent oxidoreductase n=1 Tax=Terrirubrum flagellatum TaxID=2895980 RepID=UPI00314521CF